MKALGFVEDETSTAELTLFQCAVCMSKHVGSYPWRHLAQEILWQLSTGLHRKGLQQLEKADDLAPGCSLEPPLCFLPTGLCPATGLCCAQPFCPETVDIHYTGLRLLAHSCVWTESQAQARDPHTVFLP